MSDLIDVDGVLRPMHNSDGRLIHPSRQGILNFWRWHADSKVVDAAGLPRVVYHGTIDAEGGFDVFDRTAGRYATHARSINAIGSWFTSCAADADVFAGATNPERFAEGGQVLPVYLSVQKPFRVRDSAHLTDLWRLHGGGDARLQNGDPDRFRAWAKTQGIDGFVMDARQIDAFAAPGSLFYVALEPTQVKSALGSSGAFSPKLASFADARPVPVAKRRAPDNEPSFGR